MSRKDGNKNFVRKHHTEHAQIQRHNAHLVPKNLEVEDEKYGRNTIKVLSITIGDLLAHKAY